MTGELYPAIRLNTDSSDPSYENRPRLDKEKICLNVNEQCFVNIQVSKIASCNKYT